LILSFVVTLTRPAPRRVGCVGLAEATRNTGNAAARLELHKRCIFVRDTASFRRRLIQRGPPG